MKRSDLRQIIREEISKLLEKREIPFNKTNLNSLLQNDVDFRVIGTGGGYADTREFELSGEQIKKFREKGKLDLVYKNAKQAVVGAHDPQMRGRRFVIVTEHMLKETKEIMTAAGLIPEIEKIIRKYFPHSTLSVSFNNNLGSSIGISFAVGTKGDWANGIYHNDVANTGASIFGFDKEGNITGNLEFEPRRTVVLIKPPETSHFAYGRAKVSVRKKRGDVSAILKGIDSMFSNLKKVLKANFDNLSPGHEYAKNY